VKITYQGPHDGVDVPLADGRVLTAMHGEPTAFPDEVAKSLLANGEWVPADEPALKKDTIKKAHKAEED
jgi:hypothetical protein